ncbi:epoxide hydrolase [Myxococcota bacterium]|nr:epoxide hydrolase [Myxococcota bacterium]
MSETIEPFQISVAQDVLDDLRRRLEATRFPDQIPGTNWDYGAEIETVRELVSYWRDSFDWSAVEKQLNAFDHFRTNLDGQSIHFIHARSKVADALPVVISHGWPGTVVEFLKVIGPLTDPEAHGGSREDAFHVICPSLPGYGFSEPTRTTGWDAVRIADAFAALMARLGYQRYGAQGGDWGALITTQLGQRDPEHCCGIHLNMAFATPRDDGDSLSEEEKSALAYMAEFNRMETGYQRIQGTRPQTLGFGLNDSPAGLAAWIVEKFRAWSDCGGDVFSSFTRDELLANITVYWVTQTITSSTRLYYEVTQGQSMRLDQKVEVPTGVARFPKEVMQFPRRWLEHHYNITHWSEMPRGGHFAAMEVPDLFVEDVRAFFRSLR